MFRFLKNTFIWLVAIYGILCVLVYFEPQLFFYHPYTSDSNLETARKRGYPAQRIDYEAEDGIKLFAWYTKPQAPNNKIVVFLHGNSYNVERFFEKMIPFYKKGYGTFMPEYRGFGGVEGKITQENLQKDAMAALNQLKMLGYKNEDIIVYGMSLGSHMATYVTHELKPYGKFNALVLEVPFDSLLNVVKTVVPVWMPFDFMVRDKYDNLALIKEVDTRVLVMGAKHDRIVPVQLAENLFRHAVNPKKVIIYKDGTHNNLYELKNYNDILAWLEGNEKSLK